MQNASEVDSRYATEMPANDNKFLLPTSKSQTVLAPLVERLSPQHLPWREAPLELVGAPFLASQLQAAAWCASGSLSLHYIGGAVMAKYIGNQSEDA